METNPADVSSIQDEEVLRRMWQQTADFGKKKEIRTHMYKLREARLKEFYTSGEVMKDVQRSNSSPGLREQHTKNQQWQEGPTHADSLADHSFLSLKSKEIRDSESPTRDVQYRNAKNRGGDGAWTISSSTEKTDDGKMVKSALVATTQGSRAIDGGNLSFAAANEQQTSVYSDGDANNFTKSLGESSKTFAHQDVTVGDDKNYQSTKSTTSSSSSKFVSHHSSTTGDKFDTQNIDNKQIGDGRASTVVTKKVYSSDIPDDLKKDILDGKTKVITETKTLPDGSTVTTTRYETKGAKKWSSSSSSNQVSSSRQVMEERSSSNKQVEYATGDNNQQAVKRTTVVTNVKDGADNIRQIQPDERTEIIRSTKSEAFQDNSSKTSEQVNVSRTQESVRDVQEQHEVHRRTEDVRDNITNRKVVQKHDMLDGSQITDDVKVTRIITQTVEPDYIQPVQRKPVPDTEETHTRVTTTKTTRSDVSQKSDDNRMTHIETVKRHEHNESPQIDKIEYVKSQPDKKQVTSTTTTVHETYTVPSTPKEVKPKPVRPSDSDTTRTHSETTEVTDTHRRNIEPPFVPLSSRPDKSQPSKKPTPTPTETPIEPLQPCSKGTSTDRDQNISTTAQEYELNRQGRCESPAFKESQPSDQYTTTYRTDFPNKRITVDVSPTHDAFARSLRSVSPDRVGHRPGSSPPSRASNRSLRTSSSSLRSSPEKTTSKPSRVSPDRKPTPDRYSPDRRTRDKSYSPERRAQSPTKSPERKKYPEQTESPFSHDRHTKTKPDSKRKTSSTPYYSRTPSPTKPGDRQSSVKPSDRHSPAKQSPTRITEITTTSKITRNQTSPERAPKTSPSRSTSPQKATSPVKSPTKSPTEPYVINTDTITRKKKVPTDDVSTKTNDVTVTKTTEVVNTDTITRRKETSPGARRSPTKSTDSPTRSPSKPTTETSPKKQSPVSDDTKPTPQDYKPRQSPTKSAPTPTEYMPCKPAGTKPKPTRSRSSSPTSSASDIEFISHNSHIITDLDAEDTINITLRKTDDSIIISQITTQTNDTVTTDKRPTSLNITTTKTSPRKPDASTSETPKSPTKSPTKPTKSSPTKEVRKITEYTDEYTSKTSPDRKSPVKETKSKTQETKITTDQHTDYKTEYTEQYPKKQQPKKPVQPDDICSNPDDYEPGVKPQFKRTGTYEEQCKKMLGLLETTTKPKDEYAGREPVEEPLFVKKHIDISCREDELMQETIEKITKQKTSTDTDRPKIDVPKEEVIDFIRTEKDDVTVKQYSQTEHKPDSEKPTSPVKASSPDRKSPEKTSTKKVPTREAPKESPDKKPHEPSPTKIPLQSPTKTPSKTFPQTTEQKQKPEKSPERKTPSETSKPQEKGRASPEKPLQKPSEKRKPDDDDEDKPEITKMKQTKTTNIEDVNIQERSEYHKTVEDVCFTGVDKTEFTTEYTDEYTEKLTTVPKTQDKSPTRKPTTSPDRKPTRESPSPDRKKSPKKKPSDVTKDSEFVTEEISVVTKTTKQTGKKHKKPKPTDKDTDEETETDEELDTEKINVYDIEETEKHEQVLVSSSVEDVTKRTRTDYIEENICRIPKMTSRKEPQDVEKSPQKQYKPEDDTKPHQKPGKKIIKEVQLEAGELSLTIDTADLIETHIDFIDTIPGDKQPRLTKPIDDQTEIQKITETHYRVTQKGPEEKPIDDEDYLIKCHKLTNTRKDEKQTTEEFLTTESTSSKTRQETNIIKTSDVISRDKKHTKETSPTRKEPRKQPDTKEPREGETTDRKSPSKSPVKEIKQTKPSRPTTEVKEPDDYKPKELPDRTTASLERKSSKKEITSKETVERIRELVNIESNKTEYTDEYTEKSLPYFDRKSPEKQPKSKEPEERLPEDYTTEYTNEYTPKPTSPGRKSPTKQTKQPETKLPTEKQPSDYTTEYTKEYPEKQPPVRKTTSPDRKTPLKDKEPQMKPAIEKPQKEHETEYTDEYCSKKTPQRKTTSPDRKPQTDVKPKEPTKKPEEIQPKEEHHAPKKSAQPKPAEIPKSPSKKLVTERKPSKEIPLESKPQAKTITKTTTRDQKVTSTHTTNYDTKIENKETKPTKKATDKYPSEKPTKATPKQDELPKRKSVTKDDEDLKPKQANEIVIDYTDDNLRVNKSYRTDTTKFVTSDFIGQERYDTEITLDVTNLTEPSKTRPRDDLNIEYEHPQKPHIRTHRIDTNITDIEEGETIPKRQPHKAVPSETTECTFITKQNVNENVVNITSTRKTEDIKTKIKEKKTDTVQQKLPVQNKPIKKDTLVRGSPTFDKPETRKPDHARPSSPATKVTTKQVTETEKTTHVTTRKLSPVKKPDAKPKMLDTPKASTPKTNEPVTRRSTQTSPVETAEKKPIARPTSRAPTKDSPQSRPNDLSKKHIVMKTVSLTSRTETKQPPAGKTPKVVTTTKTTRVTQPASVTVTTVRTTTKASKPKKPGTEYFESEPEQEDINEITETVTSHSKSQTDKKRVVTTTDIKLTSPVRERHSPVRDRQSPVRTGHSPVRERPSATTELIINTTKKPSVTVTSKTKKEKCITTKSIVLNKKDTETREVIIDLQRSTSSREPSPEKIYPVAVSSEDESGHPRYPDQISEPDDSPSRKPPFKIHHIPLTEEEDVDSFSRITDVTETKTPQPTRISGVDKVNETDESLLSVTEKVSRFITTAEKLTGDSQPKAKVPAPKVPRPELVVTEDLENDECLLSVSDKVNKFINTADEVTTTKQRVQQTPSTDHPVDVKVDKDDECLLSVYEKVTHFIQAAETVKKPLVKDTPTSKPARPQITDIDEGLKTDECLLSVSDKVSKFLNTTEQVTTDKFIATEKITSTQQKQSPRQSPEKVLPDTTKSRQSPTRKVPEFSKKPDDAEPLPTSTTRQQSPIRKIPETTQLKSPISIRDRKPEPTSDNSSKPIRRESPTRKYTGKPSETDDEKISRQSPIRKIPEQIQTKPAPIDNKRRPEIDTSKNRQSPIRKIPDDTSSRPISIQKQPADDKHQPSSITKITGVETKTINLKSSEAVRKAKAMFENISKNQEVPRQRDILSRPSIWEGRKIAETKKETTTDTKQSKVVDVKTDERKHSHISEVRKHLTYTSDDDENENICKRTDLKDVSLKSTKLVMGENKTHKTEQDYKVPHKPRYPSPERSSMTTTDLQKPDEQDMPHYMTPIPKVTSDDRDRLIIESRHVTQERQTFTQQKYSTDDEMTTMSETKSKTRLHTDDMPGYMRPLHRCPTPEHEPHRRPETKEDVPRSTTPKLRHTSPETEMPGYMKPLQRCTSPERDLTDGVYKHRKLSSEGEMPHYMRPLQRQTSPDREPEHKTSPERKGSREVPDDAPRAVKKFGVTLRRTDSGRAIATAITERRRSSVPGQPVIEDIQDLKVLEEMMDKVVGYEQRRRIRAQIRVVKRLISENKIPAPEDRQKKKKPQSPTREPPSQYTRKSPEKDVKKVTEQTTVRKIETENKYDEKHSTEQKIKYTEVSQERHSQVKKETQITRDEIRTSLKEERMSPDSKKKDTPTSNLYKTELKPVQPATKIITEEKPSWITNRNLKKTATESASEERRVTVSLKKKEAPRKSPSPQKDVKPIDCITSSYGIGPTDENGQPLFGIKALRRAAADKVHVRGTVVTSQFYSENGQEPVGEVSVTKYSSDPKELECDNELISKSPGFASVTTTQKFGTRGTPSLKTIIDKKKQITELEADEEETKTTTAKVTRRGSVKALSQKFVDNAVETSRNERQSYPKAGLILRTSSFKDTAQSTEKSVSRESSPGLQGRTEKISLETITADSRTTKQEEAKTFLNSHTKVASAQEVITRMKNSEHEIVAEDTAEDKEARMLLNKFLGAQVLMTGMEPLVGGQTGSSSSHHVRKMQTSRTVKETSKPVTVSKRYQCPITPEVLQDIWEEQTLRALLEQCTNYEERRHIRARLRQVMAEQEAVANVVASAVAERECDLDRTSSSTQGESLLLPLLQELLDKKGAQQSPMNRSASSQSSEESATATVDSGTESGEDLRLLAAGICDTIDSRSSGIEPLGPGLLAEVQNALSRLAVSLQLDSASVDMDPSRRQSLLQLVARLQANLIVPTRPPAEKKSGGRFARHKSRHNRHTVGVSSEELEAARKLMQEVVLRDNLSSQAAAEPQPESRVLQKQHSEGSVTNERTETKKTYSEGPVTTTEVSTRLITSTRQVSKPMSPFAKFRQLDKQNSLNTPPSSPRTPGGGCGAPLFKFTDPALSHSASTVKDRLLHWCQMKTREYQNIKLENFSSSWADGLAFCALIHHFLPDAFDYHALNPQQRRHNFTLAFKVADEQAGIYPLLDVDDMVTMKRPDWKCVFTYVQSIYRRFKDED